MSVDLKTQHGHTSKRKKAGLDRHTQSKKYYRFKASMILLFGDIDMFGDITRARKANNVNDNCRKWAEG
jgi:hypothetical protein